MGATLPPLVAHRVSTSRNVGRAVGDLYFVNTLGSAIASVAASLLLLRILGLFGSIVVAAAINDFVSGTVYRRYREESKTS